MSADDESLAALGFEPLVSEAGARVAIATRLLPTYRQLDVRQQARFEAIMLRWCKEIALTPEMFNANEGRSPGNILIRAFKIHKVRLYGFVRAMGKMKTFLIVEIDPSKKQDRADQKILKRAYNRADEIGKGNGDGR